MGEEPALDPEPPPPPPEAAPPPPPPPPEKLNEPPRIKQVRIFPDHPTTDSELRVDVDAIDPEGLPVRLDYRWVINDRELLESRGPTLAGRHFKKGDQISLTVTARDDEGERESTTKLTIANASPVFVSDPRSVSVLDGLKLEVRDPDGDEVTYRLEGAPRGMTIDAKRGILHYQGSLDEPGGRYTLKVFAEDDDGGYAVWQLGITVEPGSGAQPTQKKQR